MGTTCTAEVVGNLGKYTLCEKIGEGCLGAVYRAFDPDLGRPVAIRIVCNGIRWDAEVEARLHHDCQLAAGLQHPNIAGLFEVGKKGVSYYIVSELLSGSDLETLIAHKTALPWEARVAIMIKVAEGLSHAYRSGIPHRNLKPGKIHLGLDGSVKIRDFGIDHILIKHLTHPEVRWGAPIYMSPEQVQQREVDERSEIFCAGIIFYELLTFSHPFHDRNSNKTLDNIVANNDLPTFDRFPEVPPGLWATLKTCLAKDPSDRYQGMDEFAAACRENLRELSEESQLMLAELYGSLPRLRRAAFQPGASDCTRELLRSIQKLSLSEVEAEYALLNRLMTALIDHYPAIQAVSGPPTEREILRAVVLPDKTPDITTVLPGDLLNPEVERGDPIEGFQADKQAEAGPGSAGDSLQPAAGSVADAAEGPGVAASAAESDNRSREREAVSAKSNTSVEPSAAPLVIQAKTPAAIKPSLSPSRTPVTPAAPAGLAPRVSAERPLTSRPASIYRPRKSSKPAYRTAAVLLSILLIAVAIYIFRGAAVSFGSTWSSHLPSWAARLGFAAGQPKPKPSANSSTADVGQGAQPAVDPITIKILLKEAEALFAQRRFDECRVMIRRILEIDPANQAAVRILNNIEAAAPGSGDGTDGDETLRSGVARVSALINAGKLPAASAELDKLQRTRPDAPEIGTLRRRLEARNSKTMIEQARKEDEQKWAARRQRDDEWSRKLAEMFSMGKYAEARGALSLWLAEDPSNSRALETRLKVEEAQRDLKAYETAMEGNRYNDALSALAAVERINPTDSNLTELRRRVEARRAAARATLTIYRLSDKGTVLLDGKPIGKAGEVENESVPIGSHTIAVENSAGHRAAVTQELVEGQKAAYVYDLAGQQLRAMTDADRAGLARRKAMEELHRFPAEHSHGILRGSCKGELLLSLLDIEYKPASGTHGYRIPLRSLKLRIDGKSIDFSFSSDGKEFQNFKVQDAEAAENFKKTWDSLTSGNR